MKHRKTILAASIVLALGMAGAVHAEDATAQETETADKSADTLETVVVHGIRESLKRSLETKKDADAVDIDTVLARSDVDGVLITAPARTHTDLVIAATEAGKHVFCEKPMAITLADADRAIAAAERAGVVLQVGFNRRFAPAFAAARAAIDAGRIGTPEPRNTSGVTVTARRISVGPLRNAPRAVFSGGMGGHSSVSVRRRTIPASVT